jgi:ABC-2 type transport system permease protein
VHAARQTLRPGALWGLVFGGMVAVTMTQYASLFPTDASRRAAASAVEGNVAFSAMFGISRHVDTVAGYTAYKVTFTLMILACIWGLLVATRLLRGEEEAGRWEVLLAGRTTRRSAALQVAGGLAAGLLALWIPTAVLAVLGGSSGRVGIDASACLFFATAVTAPAAMFMAVGMLVSQLAASRHDADVLGAAILAGAYLLRMVADSDSRLGWLRWVSPLGWIEELRPLTGSRWIALVPVAALVIGLVTVAVHISANRDIGVGALPARDTGRAHTLLLGGQAGLTLRLTRPAIIAWLAALGTTGLVFGLVTQAAGRATKGSPTLERVIARLGARNAGAVLYLGFVFLVAAGLVAIAVAGQIGAIRNEEAAGHLENLLVRPVARSKWLGARLGVGAGLVVAASVLTGLMAWIGAASQHAGVHLGSLLEAGLNVAPPAVFVLGVGCLVFGLRPRLAIGATYGLVVWSFVVETVAAVFDSNHWLRDTSPFLHMSPAPAADPNWVAAGWLVALGLAAGTVGLVAFRRRDLTGA